MPSKPPLALYQGSNIAKRTFGHAVQTSQIASFSNADPQIVMLATERVGQKVRERLCFLYRSYALLEGASSLRRLNRRDSSRKVDRGLPYRRMRRNASSPYRAYRGRASMFATGCRRSQRGRHRPYLSHGRHHERLEVGDSRPTLGTAVIRAI